MTDKFSFHHHRGPISLRKTAKKQRVIGNIQCLKVEERVKGSRAQQTIEDDGALQIECAYRPTGKRTRTS